MYKRLMGFVPFILAVTVAFQSLFIQVHVSLEHHAGVNHTHTHHHSHDSHHSHGSHHSDESTTNTDHIYQHDHQDDSHSHSVEDHKLNLLSQQRAALSFSLLLANTPLLTTTPVTPRSTRIEVKYLHPPTPLITSPQSPRAPPLA